MVLKFFILATMLVSLPLFGIILAGYPVWQYLEFPPQTVYVHHAPFSWLAFAVYSLFILAVTAPLVRRAIRSIKGSEIKTSPVGFFPWWGWLSIVGVTAVWILAWTRMGWIASLQPHTFTPLWISYILVVNALNLRRSGHCVMLDRPGYFLLLFPLSALFWWFFEYLNRFVQNWYYLAVDLSPMQYFWYATLPFSTVLPAVLGTRDLILPARWLQSSYEHFLILKWTRPRLLASATLVLAAVGLIGIGVWPNFLFSLLWISPLLIIVSLQALMRERHILSDISRGDWRLVISSALAALICGCFWEMWNYWSLAKWVYNIPFVDRFKIFEMPILGYAGYLPFGLECAVIGGMLGQLEKS
jgi:heme exporter protein D